MQLCPSCSHENLVESRFCNACGLCLTESAPAIEGRFPSGACPGARYRIVAPIGRGGWVKFTVPQMSCRASAEVSAAVAFPRCVGGSFRSHALARLARYSDGQPK